MMVYKEDKDLPEWMKKTIPDEKDFEEWYEKEFMCSSSPRSPRYYQMRRAWLASKEFHKRRG